MILRTVGGKVRMSCLAFILAAVAGCGTQAPAEAVTASVAVPALEKQAPAAPVASPAPPSACDALKDGEWLSTVDGQDLKLALAGRTWKVEKRKYKSRTEYDVMVMSIDCAAPKSEGTDCVFPVRSSRAHWDDWCDGDLDCGTSIEHTKCRVSNALPLVELRLKSDSRGVELAIVRDATRKPEMLIENHHPHMIADNPEYEKTKEIQGPEGVSARAKVIEAIERVAKALNGSYWTPVVAAAPPTAPAAVKSSAAKQPPAGWK